MSDAPTPEDQWARMAVFMETMTARMDALSVAHAPAVVQATPVIVAPVVDAPPLVIPTQDPPAFTPPPSTLTGTSTSLRSLFPYVEAAHIMAVITHELRAEDLYKLDSRLRNKDQGFSLVTSGDSISFERSNRAAKDYRTFDSFVTPLLLYFDILSIHIPPQPNARTIPHVFWQFSAHLLKLAAEYEWSAVLSYAIDFVNARRAEMQEFGDYSKWGTKDADLMATHVYGNKKSSSTNAKANNSKSSTSARSSNNATTTCLNYNAGKCTAAKCPNGRAHVCSSCGKDHTVLDHAKNA
jgi:hypothetical protein